MKAAPVCAACGAEFPAAVSGEFCPACLLDLGLDESIGDEAPAGDEVAEVPGDRIGAYELLEGIGEGGFGMVFRAVQRFPVRREVALKVMKPGMDSREIVARFEAERQALAVMDHSNIAKVHDAGTTPRGRPYFVMELVDGRPLTTFCDRRRLPIEHRLELFCRICNAVQHAHQKGIIHRDLKPSNILVLVEAGGRPRPKIIDFGVAKAVGIELTEQTFITLFGRMLGTPEYMSPEQAELNAVDVDTRSDIYSLGVILYELLCGRVPVSRRTLTAAGFDRMREIIREVEPPKPSTRYLNLPAQRRERIASARRTDPARLDRVLSSDLKWVVMKALEKDRARRYDTVHGLAVDIGRYLRGLPVHASPPSTAYRVGKFVRRNRGGVAVASLVVGGLVAGIIATLVALHIQRESSWEYLKTSARSVRTSGESGWMQTALDAITRAADIKVHRVLRDEALAVFAGTDMEQVEPGLAVGDLPLPMAYDTRHHRFAIARDGRIDLLDGGTPESIGPVIGSVATGLPLLNGVIRFGGPDDRFLLVFSGSEPIVLEVHDLTKLGTETRIAAIPIHADRAVDLLPGDRGLAVGNGGEIRFVDWRGRPLSEPGTIQVDDDVVALRCRPGSTQLAVSLTARPGNPLSDRLELIDPSDPAADRIVRRFDEAPVLLSWNPEGSLLATGIGQSLSIIVPGSGRKAEDGIRHDDSIQQIAWSSDGRLLVSASEDYEIRLHNAAHFTLLSKLTARPGTLSFGPGDQFLAPVAWDGRLINLEIRQLNVCHRAPGHQGGAITASDWSQHVSAKGEAYSLVLATAASDGVRFWNRHGESIRRQPLDDVDSPQGLAFSARWLFQAGAYGIVRRAWQLRPSESAGLQLVLGQPEPLGNGNLRDCRSIALTPDGSILAAATPEGIWLIGSDDGEVRGRIEAPGSVQHLAIDFSGSWLAAGTQHEDGVFIWRLPGGRFDQLPPARVLGIDGPSTVAFSPQLDGRGALLATGDTMAYRFWTVGDWKELEKLARPNVMSGNVGRMTFSPRGTAFVVSHNLHELMVFDPRGTGDEMEVMTQPGFDQQWPLSTSRAGTLMATEGKDGRLFIWDLVAVRRAFRHLGIDWDDVEELPQEELPLVSGVVEADVADEADQSRENSDSR